MTKFPFWNRKCCTRLPAQLWALGWTDPSPHRHQQDSLMLCLQLLLSIASGLSTAQLPPVLFCSTSSFSLSKMPRCGSGQEVSASASSAASTWTLTSVHTKAWMYLQINTLSLSLLQGVIPLVELQTAGLIWLFLDLNACFFTCIFFPNSYPTEQKDIPLATPGKQLFPEDREERRANRISFPSTAEYSNKNLLLHTPSLPQTCVTLLLIAGLLHATQICHKMGTLQFCRYPTPLYYKNLASFTAQTQEKLKLFTSQVTEQDHSFSIIMDFFLLKFRLAEI